MNSTHLTDADIERFRRRLLPGDALVAFGDHLATCSDCRQRIARLGEATAALASLQDGLGIDDDGHIGESEIAAVVDGSLDAERNAVVSAHLEQCASCAEEVRDLRQFAAELGRPVKVRSSWTYTTLAVAAVLVLGVALGFAWRAQHRQPVAAIASVPGVEWLQPDDARRLRDALESSRLSLPSALSELTGRQGMLLGAAEPTAFHLVAPLATVVLGDRPTLQWTALAGSTTYTVTLQDQSTSEVSSSPPLTGTTWTPERALVRGRVYTWQVAGSIGGKEYVAPRPPDPPVRFMVADASQAARLEALPASPLVRGVLYANAGMLDEAEREFMTLRAESPYSDRVNAFLEQLRRARPAR